MEHIEAPRQRRAGDTTSPDQTALPEGWVELCSKAGEAFFHHFETGLTQAERPTTSWSLQTSAEDASGGGAAATVSGCTASYATAASPADATTPSQRGGADGHEAQADEHGSRRQKGWGGGGGGKEGEKQKTPFTRCATATTDFPSPEPPQELSSPMRRRRLEHPVARHPPTSDRTRAAERIVSDIWRDPSPAASLQENSTPNSGACGSDGGDHRGSGRCGGGDDLRGGDEADEGGRTNSVRNLAAMFGGATPPRGAGQSDSTLSARTKSSGPAGSTVHRSPNASVATSDGVSTKTTSPSSGQASPRLYSSPRIDPSPPAPPAQNLGAGVRAAGWVPPSTSPPDPPGQGTDLSRSNRLDLLRARTSSAGARKDNSDEWRGGDRVTAEDDRGRRRAGGSDGFEKDNEAAAEGKLSPASGNAASIRSGLTLAHDRTRGGLLSKSGALRLMTTAGGGDEQKSSGAVGKDKTHQTTALQQQQNYGSHKSETANRPTATIPRAAQGASGDSGGGTSSWYRVDIGGGGDGDDDHGEDGVQNDGGVSDARRQRSQTRKSTSARASTSNTTAVIYTAGVVGGACAGRVTAEIAPEVLSTTQPRGSSDNRPGPSPASVSGYSTPAFVERPRRKFFDSPRQARTGGLDDNAAAGGDGGGNRPKVVVRPKTARTALAGRKADVTSPATNESIKITRPTTSVAAAAAAAAASRGGRGTASSSRRRWRSSSDSPPSTPRDTCRTTAAATGCGGAAGESRGFGDGGNALSTTVGAGMFRKGTSGSTSANQRATAAVAAAVAATAALNQKPFSPPRNGIENARPITSRSRSLSPGTGRRGSAPSRPVTSVPPSAPGSRGGVSGGGEANDGGRGGAAVRPSDGAPGYRVFVEARFHKGNGAAQLLMRFNAKSITELMSHTTASPRHAILSSTRGHLAEASIGMFRKIQSYMGDAASGDSCERAGDEATLCGVLLCGRSNLHLACELYCQLVKQTHRCMKAENEERGFLLLACTAFLFPPPTDAIATVVLGHLALHRARNCPVGGLALFTHHHVSNRHDTWTPVLDSDPLIPMSERMRDCARNCFVPGTVFGVTIAETLRQEYYAVGVGTVTSPAPPEASESARVPIMVQLLVQTMDLLGGVRTEGIFRRPGHAGAKAALMKAISAGDYSVLRRLRDEGKLGKGQLSGDEDFEVDVYTVADTLKAWLRGMKEPLVPSDSYERAVAAGRLSEGKGVQQEEAIRVLLALPPPNSATLDFLTRFLSKVADQEKKNRMNAKSLAVVLSPNLLRNPEGDPLIFKENAHAETIFVKSLIEGSRQ